MECIPKLIQQGEVYYDVVVARHLLPLENAG